MMEYNGDSISDSEWDRAEHEDIEREVNAEWEPEDENYLGFGEVD